MKRLILIICLILSCILFINECRHISDTEQTGNMYASKKETAYPENYVPIPKELSNQYKAEMEQIIDEEYPKAITAINNYEKQAGQLYNKIIKNKHNSQDIADFNFIYEICIPAADLPVFERMTKVTQEKYLKIEYKAIATDNSYPFAEYLHRYLQDNNVNTQKLNSINDYANTKIISGKKKLDYLYSILQE